MPTGGAGLSRFAVAGPEWVEDPGRTAGCAAGRVGLRHRLCSRVITPLHRVALSPYRARTALACDSFGYGPLKNRPIDEGGRNSWLLRPGLTSPSPRVCSTGVPTETRSTSGCARSLR